MPQYFAFLRAINAGQRRTVKMSTLRQIFEQCGFSEVETFIASGNVVFRTHAEDPNALEVDIEDKLRKSLGMVVATFLRTEAELAEIARFEPFTPSEMDAGAEINVILLSTALDQQTGGQVLALSDDHNLLRVHGREIFWLRYPKPGSAGFSTPPFEKTLLKPFTIRGLRTMKRLAAKYVDVESG